MVGRGSITSRRDINRQYLFKTIKEANMNEAQKEEFKKIANQMIKFLNDNRHPHTKVIIDCNTVELVEGVLGYQNNDFIKD